MGFLPGFRKMQWLLPPDGRDISYPQFSSTLHSSSNLKSPERACIRFRSYPILHGPSFPRMVSYSVSSCKPLYDRTFVLFIGASLYPIYGSADAFFSEMRNRSAAIRGLSFSNAKRCPILEMERLPCFNAIASAVYFLKLMTGSPALTGPSCVSSTEARSSVFVRAMMTTVSWPAALILSLEKESRGSPAFT